MLSNCTPDVCHRIEHTIIEVDDVEPDSDEPQTVIDRNSDPDFLTIKDDSLLAHAKPPPPHNRAHY